MFFAPHGIFHRIHGVGKGTQHLYIEAEEHRKLSDYLNANRKRIWTAPAVDIIKYLTQWIGHSPSVPGIASRVRSLPWQRRDVFLD